MSWSGEWHPLAARFPMLSEDELREMAASIAEHGQFVPCRMDSDGVGLDGRNRVAACALADRDPRWEIYDGDPIAFIVEVNAERRHLTTGQRAMATAIGLADAGKRRNGRFERGSVPDNADSRVRQTWTDQVRRAGLVLDHAPELADPVLRGDLALDAAHKQADEVRRQRDRVTALGGELAALVESEVIDLDEAERRAAEAVRVAALPDDLAARVSNGNLAVDEAEDIVAQNNTRLDAWAENLRDWLGGLMRMAGHPVPVGLAQRLTDDQNRALGAVLNALSTEVEV